MMYTRLHFYLVSFPETAASSIPQQPEIGNFILEVNLQLGGRTTQFYNEYWGVGGLRNYGALWAGYRKQLEPFTPEKDCHATGTFGIWNFQLVGIVWGLGDFSLSFALCGCLLWFV